MSESLKIKKGTVIFRQGDASDCLYYIDGYGDAEVGIYLDYGTDDQVLMNTMYVDNFLGEMGVLNDTARSATAVALKDISVKKISKDEFHDFFANDPALMLELLKTAAKNLRRLTDRYMEACTTVNDYLDVKIAGKEVTPELQKRIRKYAR